MAWLSRHKSNTHYPYYPLPLPLLALPPQEQYPLPLPTGFKTSIPNMQYVVSELQYPIHVSTMPIDWGHFSARWGGWLIMKLSSLISFPHFWDSVLYYFVLLYCIILYYVLFVKVKVSKCSFTHMSFYVLIVLIEFICASMVSSKTLAASYTRRLMCDKVINYLQPSRLFKII